MSPAIIITWLGWICFAGAGVALIVYLVHFAGRQGWKRPWNAAGLFFTSIALSQMPSLFQYVGDARGVGAAFVVTLCLLSVTGVQAFSALRRRRQEDRILSPDAALRDRRA